MVPVLNKRVKRERKIPQRFFEMVKVQKKLQRVGGSLSVVLPKIWCDEKGLGPHDIVELRLNDEVVIRPPKGAKTDGRSG